MVPSHLKPPVIEGSPKNASLDCNTYTHFDSVTIL